MDFYANVRKLGDKLAETLSDYNLLHTFETSKYPITLTVRQNKAPDAQMELFDTTDGRMSSQDSVLRLIFDLGGMEIQTDNRLVISDALMSKVKGLAKKLHHAYLEAYFADRRNAERVNLYGDPDADGEGEASTPTEDPEDGEGVFKAFFDEGDSEPAEDAETEDGAEA